MVQSFAIPKYNPPPSSLAVFPLMVQLAANPINFPPNFVSYHWIDQPFGHCIESISHCCHLLKLLNLNTNQRVELNINRIKLNHKLELD
jgi:hypothetical protein